jgi:hypothetical protein
MVLLIRGKNVAFFIDQTCLLQAFDVFKQQLGFDRMDDLQHLTNCFAKAYGSPTEVLYTNSINVTEARAKLYTLIDEMAASHQPVIITGKRGKAVFVSEDDWKA